MLGEGHHSLGAFNSRGRGLLAGRQSLLWNKKHTVLQSLLLSCGGKEREVGVDTKKKKTHNTRI